MRLAVPAGDRHGLALMVMIFAIVIIGSVVSAGYFVAGQQFRVGIGVGQANEAFYAAEAGLDAGLFGLSDTAAAIQPGATHQLVSGRLSSSAEYEVRLTRLDAGHDEGTAYYLMVSTGRTHGAWGGRRQVATFLRARSPDGLCCGAAMATRGEVVVTGGAVISGLDPVPHAWASVPELCEGVPQSPGPGVVLHGDGSLTVDPADGVRGQPAVQRQKDEEPGFLASADRWFEELTLAADQRFVGDAVLDRIQPAVGAEGTCDRSASWNWGAPTAPGHPCFDYWPIVHAAGDLRIVDRSSGQGVLLVEGDLEIDNGFEFYGIVVVRGSLRVQGEGSRLFGGVVVFNSDLGVVEVSDRAQIELSSCARSRALRGPKLYLPHPLAEFAWLEILE